LLKAGLGLQGDDLAAQLRRGRRLLPRHVRAAAQRLAAAEAMLAAPKLARQLDHAALRADARLCIQHVTPLVQSRVQHGWWLRVASWGALWGALILVICAAVAFAVWQAKGLI
jgi:hypothetical protein